MGFGPVTTVAEFSLIGSVNSLLLFRKSLLQ
jgi:hypothetical protein